MEPRKSSMIFEMMPDWEKGLISQRVMLLLRGTLTGWRNGQRNPVRFSKGKCWLLHLGKNNPRYQYWLAPASWKTDKSLVILVGTRLYMSQHCTLQHSRQTATSALLAGSLAGGRDVILHLYSALVRHTWSMGSCSGLPVQERRGILELCAVLQWRVTKIDNRIGVSVTRKKNERAGTVQSGEVSFQKDLINAYQYIVEWSKEDGVQPS